MFHFDTFTGKAGKLSNERARLSTVRDVLNRLLCYIVSATVMEGGSVLIFDVDLSLIFAWTIVAFCDMHLRYCTLSNQNTFSKVKKIVFSSTKNQS